MFYMLSKQNDLMARTKQTSDATIDAKWMVEMSDIALKKASLMNLGDTTTGIDIDEFVSKCITFMRNAGPLADDEEEPPRATQSRRRTQRHTADSDDEGDEGDAFDWEVLGKACFSGNRRPPVPGFLLGPLSVQKRVRTLTQRSQRIARKPDGPVSRPQDLQAKDLEKAENSNLTTLCKNISHRLQQLQLEGEQGFEADAEAYPDMTPEQADDLFAKHHMRSNGGIPLFEFAINPDSFGQTVENLFYISFLIRDGNAGIEQDDDGLPTIRKYYL